MSVAIESVTISAITEKRLKLQNAQWAALTSIGTNWSTLRIGMRICFSDLGISMTGPILCAGVLSNPVSGLTNGPLSNSTSHFLGYKTTSSQSWSRNASPLSYSLGSPTLHAKRVGSTNTTGAAQSTAGMSANSQVRFALILDIVKGSPNYTVQHTQANTSSLDVSYTILRNAMEQAAISNIVSYLNASVSATYSSSAASSIAVSEATNGDLNSVCVAWGRVDPVCYISEVLFAKMA